MIGELRQAVDEAGVGDRFSIFRRAWQESWDGIMMDYTQESRWAVLVGGRFNCARSYVNVRMSCAASCGKARPV